MAKKTGVLLLNLGTPDSPKVKDVRKYLREFLLDRRVIDINAIGRWLLVNLIIAPFRSPKSAEEYRKLWTEQGSPLLYHGVKLTELVTKALGKDYIVSFGMRYQNPSIKEALKTFHNKGIDKLIVLPLYPQYASATTGSTMEKVWEELSKWEIIPTVETVANFLEHPKLAKAHASLGKKYMEKKKYDHYVFTYHGLPERQILKGSFDNYCKLGECCNSYHSKNKYCYRAQCFETTRKIASELKITEDQYTVCFQSRLGKTPWIQPYTEDLVKELAKKHKNVLVFSPAFVSDCLETTIEVGETYKEDFEHAGGEEWQLVESLNSSDQWVDCIKDLVTERT